MKLVKLTVLSLLFVSFAPMASAKSNEKKEDLGGVICSKLEAQIKDSVESNTARSADKADAGESVSGG